MSQKIYQVDAFAEEVFTGNPAAVCPLESWLSEEVMQQIAMENNLAETAFFVKDGDQYELRWFTPLVEVDLCGHATLAAAYVLFYHEGHLSDQIKFHSPRSGLLTVKRKGENLTLNFPTDKLEQIPVTEAILACFDEKPHTAIKGLTDYLFVFDNEQQIRKAEPDLIKIEELGDRGVIITARGDEVDFVSRFFAPQCGVPEDPVTGSAHTTLTPYWSKTLNRNEMNAIQLSKRTGHLKCTFLGDRVEISGKAKLYMIGEIIVNQTNL